MNWQIRTERNIDWPALERAQNELVQVARENEKRAFLLLSEPQPTYTQGRFSGPEGLVWGKDEIEQRGIAVHRVSRGGQWTYHGPGQVLVYPIIQISGLGWQRHAAYAFLKTLSTAVRDWLRSHQLDVEERSKPFGLYVRGRKLVSFGLAFDRGVSLHGLAIYHSGQQDKFDGIHPCGQPGQKSISLIELGWQLDWASTAAEVAECIKKGFKERQNRLGSTP